jgi:ABC-type glycerol-3-phosphate transport system permease component
MGITRRQVTRSLMFLVLCVVVVIMLFPFLFMVLTAFKSEDQYISGNGFSLDSWAELFNVLPVVQELINSTVVTAGAVVLIIAVSTTGGFAFAKLGFRGSAMDGASHWQVFRKLMLPLSIPAITTVAVLQFIQIWDDLLIGLLFLNDPQVRTITVGLAVIQTGRVVNVPALMAGSLLSALPAVVVYLIFQRNLIQGLTMGVNK